MYFPFTFIICNYANQHIVVRTISLMLNEVIIVPQTLTNVCPSKLTPL